MSDKIKFSELVKGVIDNLIARGFKPLGYGRHKAVLVHGDYVYRIPKDVPAILELFHEDSFVRKSRNGRFYWKHRGRKIYVKLPKARLIYINGIPVQIMEKLIPVERYKADSTKYKWLDNLNLANDGSQVGFNKRKKLYCYDFAHLSQILPHKLTVKASDKFHAFMNKSGWIEDGLGGNYLDIKGFGYSYGAPEKSFLTERAEILKFA